MFSGEPADQWQLKNITCTCELVAKYLLSSRVLIKSGLESPGQALETALIAAQPSWGLADVRPKTYLLFGLTPAYALVLRIYSMPLTISGVNRIKTLLIPLVLFPHLSKRTTRLYILSKRTTHIHLLSKR